MPLEPGTRLDAYEIVKLCASGGMGEVYRARDTRLDRSVAIKVLVPSLAQDRDALARFEREAKSASALNHPHIVHIYQIGETQTPTGPTPYIAMEFVEGETLAERIQMGAPWRDLFPALVQVADALAKAHQAGIVHRDLKPANVMVTADGYAKVLDFGLAKLVEAGQPGAAADGRPTAAREGRTKSGVIVGTPGYMSPEQVQGKLVDHRSDIFSFGCMLYEVVTGRRPFEGDSAVATLHAIVYDDAPPLEALGSEASPELRRIVRGCLNKAPEHRYQTMKELANNLRGLTWAEASPSPEAVPTKALTRQVETGFPRPVSRRWFGWGALAITALGVVTGLRVWTARRSAEQSVQTRAIQVEKLTSRGNVSRTAVSPEGRYLVYASPEEERLAPGPRRKDGDAPRAAVRNPVPGGDLVREGRAVELLLVRAERSQ